MTSLTVASPSPRARLELVEARWPESRLAGRARSRALRNVRGALGPPGPRARRIPRRSASPGPRSRAASSAPPGAALRARRSGLRTRSEAARTSSISGLGSSGSQGSSETSISVPSGVRVEQDRADVDRRDAVDERMVRLRDHRVAVALEALDQVELPQRAGRSRAAGTSPARPARAAAPRSRATAGRRGERASEVEARVVGPDRVREAQRRLRHLLAEPRHQRQPLARRARAARRSRGAGRRRRSCPPTWTWIGPRSARSEDMSDAESRSSSFKRAEPIRGGPSAPTEISG